jgi:hypothetical protein
LSRMAPHEEPLMPDFGTIKTQQCRVCHRHVPESFALTHRGSCSGFSSRCEEPLCDCNRTEAPEPKES